MEFPVIRAAGKAEQYDVGALRGAACRAPQTAGRDPYNC